jgi:hypothetical protein
MLILWLALSLPSSVNRLCGPIMVEFVVVVSQKTYYVVVLWLCLLLFSSVSKHNIWWYYGWVCRCPSGNTTCGGIMVGICRCSGLSVSIICGVSMVGFVVVVVCQ